MRIRSVAAFVLSVVKSTTESLCVFDPKNQQPAGNLKKIKIKEPQNAQSVNNINLTEHANPSFVFFYETSKGEISLFDKTKAGNVPFSFLDAVDGSNLCVEKLSYRYLPAR